MASPIPFGASEYIRMLSSYLPDSKVAMHVNREFGTRFDAEDIAARRCWQKGRRRA